MELKLQLSRIKMAKVYANVLKEQSYLEQICFEHTYMTDNKRKCIIICTQNTNVQCLGRKNHLNFTWCHHNAQVFHILIW